MWPKHHPLKLIYDNKNLSLLWFSLYLKWHLIYRSRMHEPSSYFFNIRDAIKINWDMQIIIIELMMRHKLCTHTSWHLRKFNVLWPLHSRQHRWFLLSLCVRSFYEPAFIFETQTTVVIPSISILNFEFHWSFSLFSWIFTSSLFTAQQFGCCSEHWIRPRASEVRVGVNVWMLQIFTSAHV